MKPYILNVILFLGFTVFSSCEPKKEPIKIPEDVFYGRSFVTSNDSLWIKYIGDGDTVLSQPIVNGVYESNVSYDYFASTDQNVFSTFLNLPTRHCNDAYQYHSDFVEIFLHMENDPAPEHFFQQGTFHVDSLFIRELVMGHDCSHECMHPIPSSSCFFTWDDVSYSTESKKIAGKCTLEIVYAIRIDYDYYLLPQKITLELK